MPLFLNKFSNRKSSLRITNSSSMLNRISDEKLNETSKFQDDISLNLNENYSIKFDKKLAVWQISCNNEHLKKDGKNSTNESKQSDLTSSNRKGKKSLKKISNDIEEKNNDNDIEKTDEKMIDENYALNKEKSDELKQMKIKNDFLENENRLLQLKIELLINMILNPDTTEKKLSSV